MAEMTPATKRETAMTFTLISILQLYKVDIQGFSIVQ